MWVLLYRPPEEGGENGQPRRGHAAEWRVYVQEAPAKKRVVHYDNIVRGQINADSLREMKNHILRGGVVRADVEIVTVVKVNRWEKVLE